MPTLASAVRALALFLPWPIRSGAWQVKPLAANTGEIVEAPAAGIGAVQHYDVLGHGSIGTFSAEIDFPRATRRRGGCRIPATPQPIDY